MGSKGQDIQCVTSVMDDPVTNYRRIKLVTVNLPSIHITSSILMLDVWITRQRSWIQAGGTRYPQCGGQSVVLQIIEECKNQQQQMVAKVEKSIFLPCAHSASLLFVLGMGRSQRCCLIQAGGQDIPQCRGRSSRNNRRI